MGVHSVVTSDRTTLVLAGRLAEVGEPFVLVTVIEAEGSTPRNAGARMIWRPGLRGTADQCHDVIGTSKDDETRSHARAQGTIGGGQFEHLVFDAAEEHFRNKTAGIEVYTLGKDAEQCCGGRVTVFIEYVGSRNRVVVFGAGHVAKALVTALDEAPFEMIVVDERAQWNTHERYPGVRRVTDWDEGVVVALERPLNTMACVMTCSHETDFRLLRSLLAHEPPAFVGLIGSRSKRTSFYTRLAASGLEQEKIEQVECPMGLGDMGKAPMNVAVSIAGRLLLRSREMVDG